MQRYVRGKQLVKLYDYICVGCGKRKKSKADKKKFNTVPLAVSV